MMPIAAPDHPGRCHLELRAIRDVSDVAQPGCHSGRLLDGFAGLPVRKAIRPTQFYLRSRVEAGLCLLIAGLDKRRAFE